MDNEHATVGPDQGSGHTSTLRSVIAAATSVVDGVDHGQLADPTPCADWDVRALLNHMVATATMFAVAAANGHIPDEDARNLAGDVLGADFHGAWKDASTQLLHAVTPPEVLAKVLALPFGDTPGDVALDLAVLEIGVHAADLAQATRRPVADPSPFAAVLGILRARMTDAWRAPGILDDEQPVAPQASVLDELLAYAGRRVNAAQS